MEACYGGTGVVERSCAVARGIDINTYQQVRAVRAPAPAATVLYNIALVCSSHNSTALLLRGY
jgi:hypothetical protein